MQSKLIAFKDWLIQSKAWQLRLVATIALIPFAILAIFYHSGANLAVVVVAIAIIVAMAPKIRQTLLSAVKFERVAAGVVGLIISLIAIAVIVPVFQVWIIGLNIGILVLAQNFAIIFSPEKPKFEASTQPRRPEKKKPNKKNRKRYG